MVILFILGYILNVFLNRFIYFRIVKLDRYYYPNPTAFFLFFLSLVGTIVLSTIYICLVVKHPKKPDIIQHFLELITMKFFRPPHLGPYCPFCFSDKVQIRDSYVTDGKIVTCTNCNQSFHIYK